MGRKLGHHRAGVRVGAGPALGCRAQQSPGRRGQWGRRSPRSSPARPGSRQPVTQKEREERTLKYLELSENWNSTSGRWDQNLAPPGS